MDSALPQPLNDLIDQLVRLPGIGRKSATRLALHLLSRPREEGERLADALGRALQGIESCRVCFHITDAQPCGICSDPRRQTDVICVVEDPMDLLGIERSGGYRGLYHVLGGALSPLAGIGPDSLTIGPLLKRIAESGGAIRELIVATNPTPEGDATAAYLRDRTASLGIRITRLATGLPQGGDLEYLDGLTIRRALEHRRQA